MLCFWLTKPIHLSQSPPPRSRFSETTRTPLTTEATTRAFVAQLGDRSLTVDVNDHGVVILQLNTTPLEDGVWNLWEGNLQIGGFKVTSGNVSTAHMFASLADPERLPRIKFSDRLEKWIALAESLTATFGGKRHVCTECGHDHVIGYLYIKAASMGSNTNSTSALLRTMAEIVESLSTLGIERVLVNLLQAPEQDLKTVTGHKSRAHAQDHLDRLRAVLAWKPYANTPA